MKEKHLKYFAGVFVLLLLLFFITRPRQQAVNLDEFVQNIIIGVSKEDIKQIEIYKPIEAKEPARLLFVKHDDRWHLQNHYNARVQEYRMNTLLDHLLEMTGKVRSEGIEHFNKYQITDTQGIHLLMKDGSERTLANLILGKKSEDSKSQFVRFADREKVYFADKNLFSDLNVYGDIDTLSRFQKDVFVDLQAVKEDKNDLQQIALFVDRKELVVKKTAKEAEVIKDSVTTTETQEEWLLLQNGKEVSIKDAEMKKFLNNMTSIRAAEIVDNLTGGFDDMNKNNRYGFSRPKTYLILEDKEGQRKNIIFGKTYDDDEGVYMQIQWEGLIYKLSKSNYDNITKWLEELPKQKADA